jgi:hypothetical protein
MYYKHNFTKNVAINHNTAHGGGYEYDISLPGNGGIRQNGATRDAGDSVGSNHGGVISNPGSAIGQYPEVGGVGPPN